MKKALRYARLSLWIVGFACLTWFLIVYTPWYKLFPEDHSKSAATGQPLVKAIYAYRNEHGLWPDGTEPFFAEWESKGWRFRKDDAGWPQVLRPVNSGVAVGYDFDPANRGWKAFGQFVRKQDEKLATPQEIPPEPTRTPEEWNSRALAEYDRRIKAFRYMPENWQSKGALLRELGRHAELDAFLQEAAAAWPPFYWPAMAQAALEWERAKAAETQPRTGGTVPARRAIGDPFAFLPPKPIAPPASLPATLPTSQPASHAATAPASAPATASAAGSTSPSSTAPSPRRPITAGEKFVAAMVDSPSFARYFYVYTYARLVGDDAAALRAIELAMEYPLIKPPTPTQTSFEVLANTDTKVVPYYLYRMARFAYTARQPQLCLEICEAWSALNKIYHQNRAPQDMSFLALAAAANLALGKFDLADSLAQAASIAEGTDARMRAKNLDALGNAARAKNSAFLYVPNPDGSEPEFNVWERTVK